MPAESDVLGYRARLVTLTDLALADLASAWASWSWDDPPSATASAVEVVPDVVWTWQDTAAALAADVYDQWRDDEGVRGSFRASPAAVAELDQIEAGIRNAVGPLWQESPDSAAARSLLQGMAGRLVMRGANDTVVDAAGADPQAVGWQRVARSGACRFCRMLASRGAVYRSEKTSRFAAHDRCRCAAVCSWDQDAPEAPAIAYVASSRSQTPQSRARVRAYLDANFPE